MDRLRNPYTPGAGARPPALVGRDEVLEKAAYVVQRTMAGRHAKSLLLIGLRGVGKTVLLDWARGAAVQAGVEAISIEAPEGRSLPAMLGPQLRKALLRLSTKERASDYAKRALGALAGFAAALKVKYQDIEVGIDVESIPGLADNGSLELDLTDLLEASGLAAQAESSALAIFVDELQYVKEEELAALIVALHKCSQSSLPVVLLGAGLPQLRGQMGKAKSYAERLFEFVEVGTLPEDEARRAILVPAEREGVSVSPEALDLILDQTKGYPYFLQEWGKHAWDAAEESPITLDDVVAGGKAAIGELDRSFFRVRFDRLAPAERRYLRAMAELGPGPFRSGDIAGALNRPVISLAPVRSRLIEKGMIWSPAHGETHFTVPLFDGFMKRMMPGTDWLAS